jgi:excisionase family DNA binding protein
MEALLSTEDVRTVLRISRRTFESMVARGEAPTHLVVGRQRRWKEADVAAWIESRRRSGRDRGTSPMGTVQPSGNSPAATNAHAIPAEIPEWNVGSKGEKS